MIKEEKEPQDQLLPEEWGARLSSAREEQLLSVEQAAQELNLPVEYIETLEKGALEGLPSVVFAKGYIRAYARLLNLDDNELVAEYEQIHGIASAKGQIKPVGKEHQQVKMNHPMMRITSWLLVLAIVGVSIWWWQTQNGGAIKLPVFHDESVASEKSEAVNTEAPPVVQLNNGSAQLALPQLDDKPVDSAVEDEQESSVEEAEPVEVSDQEPEYLSEEEIRNLQQKLDRGETNAEVEEVQSSVSVVESQEVIEVIQPSVASISADFVAECWVSIKDADGKTMFNNLRGKGQSVNVSGKPPLNVLIGAADAVGQFSFNGEVLDLAEHSRKNIVRINLPLSE